jgi:hypothetical protein
MFGNYSSSIRFVKKFIQLLQKAVNPKSDFREHVQKEINSFEYLNFKIVNSKLRRKMLLSKKGNIITQTYNSLKPLLQL